MLSKLKKLQPLTAEAVKEAAELLMLRNGSTTTLEVKNYLRSKNYEAFQQDISYLMNWWAIEEDWRFQCHLSYRIYTFGEDTNEELLLYLERKNMFWEIWVQEKEYTITSGEIGSSGSEQVIAMPSNRHALHQANVLIEQRLKTGFEEKEDPRLSAALRQEYRSFLAVRPERCTFSFRNCKQLEHQPATFRLYDFPTKGYWKTVVTCGYAFSWKATDAKMAFQQLSQNDDWNVLSTPPAEMLLLGELTSHTEAYLISGERLANPIQLQKQPNIELQAIQVQLQHLYKAEITYSNGQCLEFSRQEYDLENELLPLLRYLLRV